MPFCYREKSSLLHDSIIKDSYRDTGLTSIHNSQGGQSSTLEKRHKKIVPGNDELFAPPHGLAKLQGEQTWDHHCHHLYCKVTLKYFIAALWKEELSSLRIPPQNKEGQCERGIEINSRREALMCTCSICKQGIYLGNTLQEMAGLGFLFQQKWWVRAH